MHSVADKAIVAGMAELADALDSGSSEGNFMEVQVLLPAPIRNNPNLILLDYEFGFSFCLNNGLSRQKGQKEWRFISGPF